MYVLCHSDAYTIEDNFIFHQARVRNANLFSHILCQNVMLNACIVITHS